MPTLSEEMLNQNNRLSNEYTKNEKRMNVCMLLKRGEGKKTIGLF